MPATAQESFADLAFPQKGIDLSEGFNSQLPGSTPVAVNVRLFEAMTERARGGSRAGLSKYIAEQLPAGAHLIQHLNVIVDPQNIATLDEDDGTFPDPSDAGPSYAWGVTQSSRNPGRFVRQGGSGRMAVKNSKKKSFKFVQGITNHGAGVFLKTTSFPSSVRAGNLIVYGAATTDDPITYVAPSDSLGNTYTLITSFQETSGDSTWLSLWYTVSGAGGGNAITFVNLLGNGVSGAVQAEYSGNSSSPLNGFITNEDRMDGWPGTPNPFPFTSGSCPVTSTGELVVAFSRSGQTAGAGCSFTGDPAFHQRLTGNSFVDGYPLLVLQDQLSVDSGITASGSQTNTAGQVGATMEILSIAASFFHG